MNLTDSEIEFIEADLKEVFALFSSPSEYELRQTYDPNSEHYFETIVLPEEYELTEPKREFALDSLRAVMSFLHRHGYRIEKNGKTLSLEGIMEYFI
jgi:hypothetical protein